MAEINSPIEFQRGTAGVPESAKECARPLAESSDIGLGARCREFESPISGQNVLMKDAAQKTPRFCAVFSHIYQFFRCKKLENEIFQRHDL
ncbi:hypothetical protein AAAV73_00510, partial [Hominicoprocola fusiformis]